MPSPVPLALVTQRPLTEKPSDRSTCPYCGAHVVSARESRTTLLGGGGGVDADLNHTWTILDCRACARVFLRETRLGEVWYTADHHVLRGIDNCYETYLYTCSRCSHAVRKYHTELDGTTPTAHLVTSYEDGRYVSQYRTFYRCEVCGISQEVD